MIITFFDGSARQMRSCPSVCERDGATSGAAAMTLRLKKSLLVRIVSIRELSLPLSVGDCRFGISRRLLQCFLRRELNSNYCRGSPPGVFGVLQRIGLGRDQISNLSSFGAARRVKGAQRLGALRTVFISFLRECDSQGSQPAAHLITYSGPNNLPFGEASFFNR